MVLRYWYLLMSSWPRLLELIYWPALQIITWGFLQNYISQTSGFFARAGGSLIGAVILWDILFRGQLGFSISFLEEMWARNLGNLMMSPLKPIEFLISLMVMSLIRLAIGVIPMTLLALFFFDFNFFAIGLPLIAFFCNLIFTSWSIGIFVSGLVLRNGLGAESIVWTLMFGMMPLACIYYPVSGAAGLAAVSRLDAAADLRVRGHAVAPDRPCVSGRSDGRRRWPSTRCCLSRHLRSFLPFCAAPNATDRCSGVANKSLFPVDFRGFGPIWPRISTDRCIDALLRIRHYAAAQNRGQKSMPIGEFGGAPPLVAEGSPALTTPMYWMYEMGHASLNPARAVTDATKILFQNPLNPWSHTEFGKSIAAACELFERTTRRYGKPEWGLHDTEVNGVRTPVEVRSIWEKPFCRLLHFDRKLTRPLRSPQPRVLIVAPMSGHYATLLRGTVEAFLPTHEVYITDWSDARMVPLAEGRFDLDDYVDYVIEMLHVLGGNMHVIAVCQPSVPVVAAVSVMEAANDPFVPLSMTLMGGPIDTRRNPTAVNNLAAERGIEWFRNNVITKVPFPHPGVMRDVYPGFLQLSGFITMNLDRHTDAHKALFANLVKGDGDLVDKHREFYDEYLAVMDLTAEYYLQTVDVVFVKHALPKGEMTHRGKPVDPSKIRRVALMTVEGENDDISGLGQTEATHALCTSIPDHRRVHYVQKGVGHYGVFNGSRFRSEIVPRISDFMMSAANTKPKLVAAAE